MKATAKLQLFLGFLDHVMQMRSSEFQKNLNKVKAINISIPFSTVVILKWVMGSHLEDGAIC